MQYGLTPAQVARIRTGDIIGNRMWPELTFRVLKPAYVMPNRYEDNGWTIEARSVNAHSNYVTPFTIWALPRFSCLALPEKISLPTGI